MGFGLVTEFIEHLLTVTTSNHGAIANSHSMQSALSSPVVVW
jgi:hypothetical protein